MPNNQWPSREELLKMLNDPELTKQVEQERANFKEEMSFLMEDELGRPVSVPGSRMDTWMAEQDRLASNPEELQRMKEELDTRGGGEKPGKTRVVVRRRSKT